MSEEVKIPILSVVIPFYNSELYLAETMESVLRQSFPDFEVVLIDDCSTDDSANRIQPYLSDRVRYFRQPTNMGGPSAPRNAGIRLSRGKYVAFFDADDLMLPGKLAAAVGLLEQNPGAGLLCTNFKSIGADGREINGDFLSDYRSFRTRLRRLGADGYRLAAAEAYTALLGGNFIGTSSVVIPRHVLEEIGGFDEDLSNGDDYDLWLRIVRRFDVLFIDRAYHSYRIAGGSVSSRGARNALNRIKVLEKQLSLPLDAGALSCVHARLRVNYQQFGDAERRRGNIDDARTMLRKSLSYGISWPAIKGLAATYVRRWTGFQPTHK